MLNLRLLAYKSFSLNLYSRKRILENSFLNLEMENSFLNFKLSFLTSLRSIKNFFRLKFNLTCHSVRINENNLKIDHRLFLHCSYFHHWNKIYRLSNCECVLSLSLFLSKRHRAPFVV